MKKDESGPKQPKKNKSEKTSLPLMSESVASTKTRSNRSASIERTNRFKNIEDGIVPFNFGDKYKKDSNINVRDAVILCQKAYYNFSIFRNVIDLMTEFSVSNIYLREGSNKSRDFFNALFDKINIWTLQDKFFREYYRSGNVFIYRYDAEVNQKDVNKMAQTFGFTETDSKFEIPARYVILNPADIQAGGNISFVSSRYYKMLSGYELERLKNPRTQEDKEVFNALDEDVRSKIKSGSSAVSIPLNPERINAVFYKKMDYEPFAVPMGYPVLDDINWKAEMKKMDMAVTRTMQQSILLITMGTEPDKGGINQKNLEHMQGLFSNESVGKVLIADYTTKGQFIIPDIANLLDPKKYDVVNRDIEDGLLYILGGGEKFANQSTKAELFVARLKQARETFLNQFLAPEIKRIAKELGFKNYPVPFFHKLSFKNNDIMSRIYSRLTEIGVLTPEEGIEALETGKLPSSEESTLSQERYVKLRKKGLYEPVTGGPNTQLEIVNKNAENQRKLQSQQNKEQQPPTPNGMTPLPKIPGERGRPTGSPKSKAAKVIEFTGDIGKYSLSKIKDNFAKSDKLNKKVEKFLKEKHNLENLNEEQKTVAFEITKIIVTNEDVENWDNQVEKYANNPTNTNPDRIKEIQAIADEHHIDNYSAGILYLSRE